MFEQEKRSSGNYLGTAGYVGNAKIGDMPSPTDPGQRVPELIEQALRMEKALTFAEDSLRELDSRLCAVLRPQPPETNGAVGQIAGPSTHYGQQMCAFGSRAGLIGERIQDMLRRLEI